MKAKINKTNAVRLLDKAKIDYELIPYEVDEMIWPRLTWRHSWRRISNRCSKR